MSVELKYLRNVSDRPQECFFGGNSVVMEGHAEDPYPVDLANAFLEQCKGYIVDISESEAKVFNPRQTSKVWIANGTGNPDARETIKDRVWNSVEKRWVMEDQPNMLLKPRQLTERMKGGMQEYQGEDGPLSMNLPDELVVIPPYKRVEVTKAMARTMRRREASAAANEKGRYIQCRAPAGFEPDMTWDLNELRAYLRMVAGKDADLGPTKEALQKKFKDEKQYRVELFKAVQLCYRRIFFKLIDSSVNLPTRETFNAFMKGHETEDSVIESEVTEDQDVDEVLETVERTRRGLKRRETTQRRSRRREPEEEQATE